MQALGFCFSMVPAIRRLYPENNDARKQAIKRHLEFFNTHPYVAAPVLGVTLAMEEQRANGAEIDDGAINGIKVGLMGPLAGVGDPIFWGTVRPVFAALGAGIAMSGSLLRSSAVLYPVQRGASADPLLRRRLWLSQRRGYR